MSFVIVVLKMLHPKPSVKILKISVKKNNLEFNFVYFRKNIVLSIKIEKQAYQLAAKG